MFPLEEIRDLYLLAINYCIKRLNEGASVFAREGLDLYQEGLRTNILLLEGKLSRFAYRNIVGMGLKVGDFTWVGNFIHKYKGSLAKDHRESMFSFCLARLEYRQGNYGRALQLLQKSEYRDLLLNLAAKTLQLKVYYESDEWELLHSHLEAMKNFVRRKKIIGYHKTNYNNIILFTRKLLQLNMFSREQVNQLAQLVEAEEVLTEKDWFLERLRLLEP